MKEYVSTTGGRHLYSSDIKNLQELALAMEQIFKDCGGNFVISGCQQTNGSSHASSGDFPEGYVYIDGKIRHVDAKENLQYANLKIVAKERTVGSIPYNDGSYHPQYTEYYAEYENTDSVDTPYIALYADARPPRFPNLKTFFRKYTITKEDTETTEETQAVYTGLSIYGTLFGEKVQSNGDLIAGHDKLKIYSDDNGITFEQKSGVSVRFSNDHKIYYKYAESQDWQELLAGIYPLETGLMPHFKQAQIDSLYIKDIQDNGDRGAYAPVLVGSIQIWAGMTIPTAHYCLCDGRLLKKTDYADLYSVIGDTYNTAYDYQGRRYAASSSDYFRIPDLRGRFVVGYNPNETEYAKYGNVGGEKSHTLSESEMPQHKHTYDKADLKVASVFDANHNQLSNINVSEPTKPTVGADGYIKGGDLILPELVGVETAWNEVPTQQGNTGNTGGSRPHENRPPFYTLAYIIRVK